MKIAHVIGRSESRGAHLQLSYLAAALSHTFDVEVIAPQGAPVLATLSEQSIRATELPLCGKSGFRLSDIRRFERYFLRTKPDIVHTHGNLAARVGAALAGVPYLLSTRHDCRSGRAHRSPLRAAFYNALTAMTVATTPAAGRRLCAEGVPADRIVTIQNGVPTGVRADGERLGAVRRSLGISLDTAVIGSVLGDGATGGGVLLRAFARVAMHRGEVVLLLFGVGKEERELCRLASLLGIGERVRIFSGIGEEFPARGLFTLYVAPAEIREEDALRICTLMSLGTVTVAADTESAAELLCDGENGALFQPDNAYDLAEKLLFLLGTQDLLPALSRGALSRYAREFSLSRMERAYTDLYRRVVSSRRKSLFSTDILRPSLKDS